MAFARGGHAGHVARKLGDIVKLPLLRRESKERIGEIWAGHHQSRPDAIGRDLNASHARLLTERAEPAPLFVFPVSAISTRCECFPQVHRQSGYFMMLSQFQNRRHFLFTYLEDYKKNPTFAQPNVTVTLHDDLADEKGIVLLRADVESMLTKRESEHLVDQLIQSYLVSAVYN